MTHSRRAGGGNGAIANAVWIGARVGRKLATMDRLDMPRLDALDEEFGVDSAARTVDRLLMLGIMALGLGVIGAVVFAWSNADGPLRLSAATAPKSAQAAQEEIGRQRATAQEEIEQLRGELDGLKKELTETQYQAAHTIAAMKAAEVDLRRHVPPPYWYSNPATLDLTIVRQRPPAGFAPPPRRR